MKAICLVQIQIRDAEGFKGYMERAPQTVRQYGGRHVVRGGRTVTLEGPTNTTRNVVIEFDTVADAERWYNSPEYQDAKKYRDPNSDTSIIVIEVP